jgi:hypothetical protein
MREMTAFPRVSPSAFAVFHKKRKKLEKISKNLKKGVDKRKRVCYNNKAVAKRATSERALILEN